MSTEGLTRWRWRFQRATDDREAGELMVTLLKLFAAAHADKLKGANDDE